MTAVPARDREPGPQRFRELSGQVGWGIFTWVVGIAFFLPVLWMLITAFKPESAAETWPPRFTFSPTLAEFRLVFSGIGPFLTHSVIATIGSTVLVLLLGHLRQLLIITLFEPPEYIVIGIFLQQIGQRRLEFRLGKAAGRPTEGQGADRRIAVGIDSLLEVGIQVLHSCILLGDGAQLKTIRRIGLFEAVQVGHGPFDLIILFAEDVDQVFQLIAGLGTTYLIKIILLCQVNIDLYLCRIIDQGNGDHVIPEYQFEYFLRRSRACQAEAAVHSRYFGRVQDNRRLVLAIRHFQQIDLGHRSFDSSELICIFKCPGYRERSFLFWLAGSDKEDACAGENYAQRSFCHINFPVFR